MTRTTRPVLALRLLPLLGLLWLAFSIPQAGDKLPGQSPGSWRAESRNARGLARLLIKHHPGALDAASGSKIVKTLGDFRLADRTRRGTIDQRTSLNPESVQERLTRADKLYKKATQEIAAALELVPDRLELTGPLPMKATREMTMPFRSGLLLVHRRSAGAVPTDTAKRARRGKPRIQPSHRPDGPPRQFSTLHQERPPLELVTDKLRSYPAAHREVFPSVTHRTGQYENNRAEVSHQHTREQERQMRHFESAAQVQRFLSVHGAIHNLFRVARHHLKAIHHRLLRERAFTDWQTATSAC